MVEILEERFRMKIFLGETIDPNGGENEVVTSNISFLSKKSEDYLLRLTQREL
ncbi:hypothetical protein LZ575_14285 [Antarcticibacterium sp. 1MA-6-2]|uniref:hypothetical protein n=1 Tax=Antarcticibacterium sp. 1MA-6-2 TaxID=2908210 RepID=UPI001F1CACA8|nr:hypothetical protein [Antarcticibacterium sp. 1MA-6-2]UJH90079.1 hypothetical protein LZ575_14285 [Antarcticibacterium sp. 1MA-6-2]